MKRRATVYLHTGTNLGSRLQNLSQANDFIEEKIGPIIQESKIYLTEAWGVKDQPDFLNQALKVETALTPQEVLKAIAWIENELGRKRVKKWHSRIIDVDILFFENQIINEENLIIPHPHLHERKFVLKPLLDIASDYVHPVFEHTIIELYEKTLDPLNVKSWN